MQNTAQLRIRKEQNTIHYEYIVRGPWAEAFHIDGIQGWFAHASEGEYKFFIQYDESIEDVPDSVAAIPFICNVLPILWLYDAELEIDELDLDFFNSLSRVREAYQDKNPNETFAGRVLPKRVILNTARHSNTNSLVFFSGGVDAHYTLLKTLEQKPILATIWGSDLYFKDKIEWEITREKLQSTAARFNLPYTTIKSSFRFFLNYELLNKKFAFRNKENWWHGFQHGIGIISHAAPLAWIRGLNLTYISSSYSPADGVVKCASYPTFDEGLEFSGCSVRHLGFYKTRQQKVASICYQSETKNLSIELRVCWESGKNDNCCQCEKCLRTFFAVMAEGYAPENFGFKCNETVYSKIIELLDNKKILPNAFWADICEKLGRQDSQFQLPHVKKLLSVFPHQTT